MRKGINRSIWWLCWSSKWIWGSNSYSKKLTGHSWCKSKQDLLEKRSSRTEAGLVIVMLRKVEFPVVIGECQVVQDQQQLLMQK